MLLLVLVLVQGDVVFFGLILAIWGIPPPFVPALDIVS